jgi:predicted homoserine dehydrogenase-like protein
MIGLYKDLEAREKANQPVRIGLLGTGQMGTDVIAETRMMKGVEVVIAVDIDLERAFESFRIGQVDGEVVYVETPEAADQVILAGKRAVARDYRVVTAMKTVDVMLDATGVPEIGARAALRSARNGQQVSMMNVEADITVGPILNWYAGKKGVTYALAAGDEPAACKELYDFATALGFTIVAAGKGKNNPLDRHSSPDDPAVQKEAARRGLNPFMLVEFVDGSKTMIEMAAVSTDRDHLNQTFALQEHGGVLNKMGVVDFGVGHVAPGVFLIVRTDHPRLREAMILRDMGNGPYYTLFRPFHLCSIEVPLTCALQVIHHQSNMTPSNKLYSEVFAVAKRDLKVGDVLDSIGGTTFYSLIDTYEQARRDNLLPIGLAKSARMLRPVKRDTPITCEDVEVKPSTILELRLLQNDWMAGKVDEESLLKAVDKLALD